mgnify:CR=1 FL=1
MNKTKIFYVEDEQFLAKIVSESLQGRGYEVVVEADGGRALSTFTAVKPDICLLDVMLPQKDGFTIADEIREIDTRVPIIFLTARSAVADVVALDGEDLFDYEVPVDLLRARLGRVGAD